MAAPAKTYYAEEFATFSLNAAAAAVTMDLPAPGAGMCWIVLNMFLYAVGTVTAFDLSVGEAGGGVIALIGGQVGGVTNGSLPTHIPIPGPIVCKPNDAAKFILTATGASAVRITATCRRAASA